MGPVRVLEKLSACLIVFLVCVDSWFFFLLFIGWTKQHISEIKLQLPRISIFKNM
jgi:hypothetical protein